MRVSLDDEEEEKIEAPQKVEVATKESKIELEADEEKVALKTAVAEDIKGERAEKFLEPMELEQTEAVPRRRGNLRAEALSQKIKEIRIDPKEGATEAVGKLKESGVSFLHHIPGLGLLSAFFAKRKVVSELKETAEQFQMINQTRMKILIKSNPSVTSLRLAETLSYAQIQLQKRFKKLQRSSFATDIQTIGAGVSTTVIGAPAGAAIAGVGTLVKGTQGLKSVITFFKKLYNRTLGVERNAHARLLYGLALEYLQSKYQVAPSRDIDFVNQALNLVGTLGAVQEREEAREQAFTMLKKLGIAPDPGDKIQLDYFNQLGFKKIRQLLHS
ncbi:MAG: hypothetical protein WCK49_02610 [Myxococcaceae bacterium]